MRGRSGRRRRLHPALRLCWSCSGASRASDARRKGGSLSGVIRCCRRDGRRRRPRTRRSAGGTTRRPDPEDSLQRATGGLVMEEVSPSGGLQLMDRTARSRPIVRLVRGRWREVSGRSRSRRGPRSGERGNPRAGRPGVGQRIDDRVLDRWGRADRARLPDPLGAEGCTSVRSFRVWRVSNMAGRPRSASDRSPSVPADAGCRPRRRRPPESACAILARSRRAAVRRDERRVQDPTTVVDGARDGSDRRSPGLAITSTTATCAPNG